MSDFIGVYQMPIEIANAVSEIFDEFAHRAVEGMIGGCGSDRVVDKSVKDSFDLGFFEVMHDRPEPILKYLEALNNCLNLYKRDHPFCNEEQAPWGIVEGINIQMYPPGAGFKKLHWEKTGGKTVNRHLAFMTFLTDIPQEHGGGTEFPQQERVLPCITGSTAIWPAEWTHAHRGVVSHTHEKRIVTGWYSFLNQEKL